MIFFLENINNEETRESSSNQQHTDFVKTTQYPKEIQRVDFVDYACKVDDSKIEFIIVSLYEFTYYVGHAVTIIVEGGINTCVAVLSEIRKQRPVIFIQVLIQLYYNECIISSSNLIRVVVKLLMSLLA